MKYLTLKKNIHPNKIYLQSEPLASDPPFQIENYYHFLYYLLNEKLVPNDFFSFICDFNLQLSPEIYIKLSYFNSFAFNLLHYCTDLYFPKYDAFCTDEQTKFRIVFSSWIKNNNNEQFNILKYLELEFLVTLVNKCVNCRSHLQ